MRADILVRHILQQKSCKVVFNSVNLVKSLSTILPQRNNKPISTETNASFGIIYFILFYFILFYAGSIVSQTALSELITVKHVL